MKKIILILAILSLAVPALAVEPIDLARMGVGMGGAVAAAGGACNPASNEVGDRTDHSASGYGSSAVNEAMCVLYTADCSGTLAYGQLFTDEAGTDNIKVAVFVDDGDSVPDSGDTLVADSSWADADSAGHSEGWLQTTGKLGGSVTQGASYWVCTIPNATFNVARVSSGGTRTRYYQGSLNYATPPSDLSGSWSTFATSERSVYVEIE